MVGDHIDFDVGAPQRLGIRGVWVDRAGAGLPAGTQVRPHRIIGELSAMLEP
jgi:putative hydrolase of the HAD superfamily